MPRIKFTRNYEVKDGTGRRYAQDQEIDVVEASAKHFINRGAAVLVPARLSVGQAGGALPQQAGAGMFAPSVDQVSADPPAESEADPPAENGGAGAKPRRGRRRGRGGSVASLFAGGDAAERDPSASGNGGADAPKS